jgi:molybdopterin-containing oxidoreductase family iron-sulfur binding subunit
MGMVIDLERCTGCLACVEACHRENNTSVGVHWMYVFSYEEENKDDVNFLVRPCQHCSNPPCVKVCPVMARHKREKDGLVLTDYNLCIGCRYCQVACPYGVNYFQWGEPRPDEGFLHERLDYRGRRVNGNPPEPGIMGKCTFCPQRQDSELQRGTTACQLGCPHDAIFFGDMNDPNSSPRLYLEERTKEKDGDISTFRLLEYLGTRPNILFIGHQPSRDAEQVTGPTSYESWGWVDERRTVLEGPRPWFMRIWGDQ